MYVAFGHFGPCIWFPNAAHSEAVRAFIRSDHVGAPGRQLRRTAKMPAAAAAGMEIDLSPKLRMVMLGAFEGHKGV